MICTCLRTAVRSTLARSAPSTYRLRHSSAPALAGRPIPAVRDDIKTPADFLTKIGRSMQEHESKIGSSWDELWKRDTESLKEAGITAPKDRKYILRQMELFRQGRQIRAIKAKPKKKFRGRGPRVQKGVRVR